MENNLSRCHWCGNDPLYVLYHDQEWGVPVYDDQKLFEFLVLEGAQAGLSWITILKRREGYRKAFANFDFTRIVHFNDSNVAQLLQDPGIIRNRLKILSAINNAKAFIKIQEDFGSFHNYQWQFIGGRPIVNQLKTPKQIPPTSKESDSWSKDLKERGFSFVGSTIVYAHMQAVGMVNDHLTSCYRYNEVQF